MALIATPHLIGSNAMGTYFRHEFFNQGAVLRRIGVWAGPSMLRGIRVWFTHHSTPLTIGTIHTGAYSEFEFRDGERITVLSLWGNGAGTRCGGIRFFTSLGNRFFHHMTSWGLQQEFAIDVASGLCVGFRGWSGDGMDIMALGFVFLLPISQARMMNVRYPTLDLQAASIQPVIIREFRDENHSFDASKEWTNTGTHSTTKSSSWSITTGVEYHASLTVSAGIPFIAEVSGEFGWAVSVSGSYSTTHEETETSEWSRSGTVGPRQWVSFQVTTRRGAITVPYDATMEVTLVTGVRFTYPLQGLYSGVNFSRVDTRTETGSLDAATRAERGTAGPEKAAANVVVRDFSSTVTTFRTKRSGAADIAGAGFHGTSSLSEAAAAAHHEQPQAPVNELIIDYN